MSEAQSVEGQRQPPPPPPPQQQQQQQQQQQHPAKLAPLLAAFVRGAPFTDGGRKQEHTRGSGAIFPQDGVRIATGNKFPNPDYPRWYNNSKGTVAGKDAWRRCRALVVAAAFGTLEASVGPALIAFQTAMICQCPLLMSTCLQAGVPYQQVHASYDAHIGTHLDQFDLLGTMIVWFVLSLKATSGRRQPACGGAFVMYDLGLKFEIGHATAIWLRSDRIWHGTIKNASDAASGGLVGVALTNKANVVAKSASLIKRGIEEFPWSSQYPTK